MSGSPSTRWSMRPARWTPRRRRRSRRISANATHADARSRRSSATSSGCRWPCLRPRRARASASGSSQALLGKRRPTRRVSWALPTALAASLLLAVGGWYLGGARSRALQRELEAQRAAVAALQDTLSIMRQGGPHPPGDLRGRPHQRRRAHLRGRGHPPLERGDPWAATGAARLPVPVLVHLRRRHGARHGSGRRYQRPTMFTTGMPQPAVVPRGEGCGAHRGAGRRRTGAAAWKVARPSDALSGRWLPLPLAKRHGVGRPGGSRATGSSDPSGPGSRCHSDPPISDLLHRDEGVVAGSTRRWRRRL